MFIFACFGHKASEYSGFKGLFEVISVLWDSRMYVLHVTFPTPRIWKWLIDL